MWGGYLLARARCRLATLQHGSVEAFLGVNFLTGMPLTAPAARRVRSGTASDGFRTSEEWGPAIQMMEEAGYGIARQPMPMRWARSSRW